MVSRPYWTFDIDRNQNTPTTATTAPRTHLSANPSNQHQAHDHVAGAVFQEAIDVAVILNALRALGAANWVGLAPARWVRRVALWASQGLGRP